MALNTVDLIATHIVENISNVSAGVSGNMVEIVTTALHNVENFTGRTIPTDSIEDQFQPAIINFATADTIDLTQSQDDAGDLKLEGLSVSEVSGQMSAEAYRKLAESSLRYVGRNVKIAKTIA